MHRYLFFITLFYSFTVFSQDDDKIADLYFEGNEYIMAEEHIEALPLFLELLKMKESANFYYKLGECYLHIPNQKNKSITYLEMAVKNASSAYDPADPMEEKAPLKSLLYLGQAYRINNEIEKAIVVFSALADSVAGREQDVIDAIDREIDICENAMLFLESPVTFDSISFGPNINDHFSNYGAVVTENEDKMYFMNALKFYDAVMESFKTEESWTKADNITMKLKSDGDFYVTDVSADGTKLLFYFYNILSMGDIYESNLVDGSWTPITKLKGEINTDFNETHASISADGKTIYFTSNRPGGYGGLDIYSCSLNDSGAWADPVNLGKVVNSARNEDTPFITKDSQKLYFASEGHFNMGGYDVFKSKNQTDGTWGKPQNLGYPVNTTDGNLFFYPHDNGESLYVSGFSPKGEGLKDIMKYWNISEPRLRKFKIKASVDADTSTSVKPGKVKLKVIHDQDTSENILLDDLIWEERFRAGQYVMITSADGFKSDTISVLLDDEQEQLTLPLRFSLTPDAPDTYESSTVKIKNIYFEFDSYTLSQADKAFLNKFYRDIKDLNVHLKITGHTDKKGPSGYNLILSRKRAEAVKDYLVSIGFPNDKIAIEAMGELKSLAKDTDTAGNDMPDGRKYNRRVELHLHPLPSNIRIEKEINIPAELLIQQ